MNWWQIANQKAKLSERAKTCNAARRAVMLMRVKRAFTFKPIDVVVALLLFWSKQPNTRVNHRIIRELTKQGLTLARA
jgi:ABC-type hemin transport system ATPase subunit